MKRNDHRTNGSTLLPTLILLALLLAIPIYALCKVSIGIDWRILLLASAIVSVIAFVLYGHDKRRAKQGGWRVPESTLQLASLLGGWPGAFLAQRLFRHKTAKVSFQIVFWAIVLLHQFAAADFVMNWKMTRSVMGAHHFEGRRSTDSWISH